MCFQCIVILSWTEGQWFYLQLKATWTLPYWWQNMWVECKYASYISSGDSSERQAAASLNNVKVRGRGKGLFRIVFGCFKLSERTVVLWYYLWIERRQFYDESKKVKNARKSTQWCARYACKTSELCKVYKISHTFNAKDLTDIYFELSNTKIYMLLKKQTIHISIMN